MDTIEEIRQYLKPELLEFHNYFKECLKSPVPLLNKIIGYAQRRKGKQIRTLLVFLCAKMLGGVTENTYRAAAFIELLHNATLIHDDVVDNSSERRGLPSVNAVWKNKAAVLVGDYFLSKGMLIALENKDYQMLDIISDAVRAMSEGELLQMEKARRLETVTESDYFDIINCKTAKLIASCCAIGALSAGADENNVLKMKQFGHDVGMAFQIKDDVLDYKTDEMAFPAVHYLNQMDFGKRKATARAIKGKGLMGDLRKAKIYRKIDKSDSLPCSNEYMKKFIGQAKDKLDGFPNTKDKEKLFQLIEYCINRDK